MDPVASAGVVAGRSGAVTSPAGGEVVSVVIAHTMATGRVSLKCCGQERIAIVIQPTTRVAGHRAAGIDGHEKRAICSVNRANDAPRWCRTTDNIRMA
jgi:hypothetical protein